jgi:hypothetical protein
MVEQEFIRLLREYPDSLEQRKRFIGLVNDFLYMQPLQANLILTLYKMDIHKEIEKVAQIDNVFAFRFIKRLTGEHGISKENAVQSVFMWCLCYGEKILDKPCEIDNSNNIFEVEDVLTFLEQLRNDNHYDSERLERIFSTLPNNKLDDFLVSVSKVNSVVYYGILAAELNPKFRRFFRKR